MKRKQLRTGTSLGAAVLLLVLAGCSSGGGFNIISLEEEWRLGQQLSADIARQMEIVSDPAANAYIQKVGQRIVARSQMANLPWNFHIVRNPEINAFNIPGGHVYVTTGLIAAADNAAEFAGVMAHEISHGVERHATEQVSRAYGLNLVAAVVLGQNPVVYQQILAQVVGAGTLAHYGREAEREADEMGVRLMYQAGYDPRGMVTMFEELLRHRQRSPGGVERFFASHPLTESRIRDVSATIAQLPKRDGLVVQEADYQRVRDRLGP
ncbi:MAG TPA: M48 family metallopeptidase [Thermoanaerobaculia bacterium]|nr:M48 family metallopeptidase [Thermoanaerobaculia bacterium]